MGSEKLLRRLGEEIRARRQQLQLTQESLAHEAGIHLNVIGRLERGTYNPSVLTLLSIATKLDVSMADLFADAARRG